MDKGCFFELARFRSVLLATLVWTYSSAEEPYQGGNDWSGGVGSDAGEFSVLQILALLPSG